MASEPTKDMASPRAIATQMAMVGATRADTHDRLAQLFDYEFRFELENLLDEVFQGRGPRSTRRPGIRRRARKRRRATDVP